MISVERIVKVIGDYVDADFYHRFYPDVAKSGVDAATHYSLWGWREGRDPSAVFSTRHYIQANRDAELGDVNPLYHYITIGKARGARPVPSALAGAGSTGSGAKQEKVTRPEDISAEIELIKSRFDEAFYVGQLIGPISEDARTHYLREGWKTGLDPHPFFSTDRYLEKNPDVKKMGINPLVHYVGWGRTEGRVSFPSSRGAAADEPLIAPTVIVGEPKRELVRDERGRKASGPSVGAAGEAQQSSDRSIAPAGRVAATDPSYSDLFPDLSVEQVLQVREAFDDAFYLAHSPDIAEAGVDPFRHFIEFGWREHRDPSPKFSTAFYLETNEDVANSETNPLVHFVLWGAKEGRGANPNDVRSFAAAQEDGWGQPGHEEYDTIQANFDADFYLNQVEEGAGEIGDPVLHFMAVGWRQGLDPAASFSTSYYLDANEDIREAGMNPFYHFLIAGRHEGRQPLDYWEGLKQKPFDPFVSVIVPNYNHARFLKQRFESIIAQTYQNFELIILDDCSTDNSMNVINTFASRHKDRVSVIANTTNSGGVFYQWKRGIEAAQGDLIWICESDDFCDPTFLERVIQPFRDGSVMMSFGRIQFSDAKGTPLQGLDHYRNQAEPGIWEVNVVRPAFHWFRGAFAVANIIPNVGGCVFRKQQIDRSIWDVLVTYKISGDWYLYSKLAQGGQIAYVHDAVAYFRQHGSNTSGAAARKADYYVEHERLITSFRADFGTPDDVAVRCYQALYRQYQYEGARKRLGPLTNHYSNDRIMAVEKQRTHVLVAFLGFHLGGGELFPIHLANALRDKGYLVSALCVDTQNENPDVRAMLRSDIPVYDGQWVQLIGVDAFIEQAGIDIIHSHSISVDLFFLEKNDLTSKVTYIITLHGSFEVTPIPDQVLLKMIRKVDHWVYLSQKNLAHLDGIKLDKSLFTQLANGMPADPRDFPHTRAEMGIGEDDVVFTIASRAIPDKGWQAAIDAREIAAQQTDTNLHLVLCGSGPEYERLKETHGADPFVHLMGFQDRINGAYRISDVAMLPSRFAGESFPLTLIQAMQVGRPIISTDIGEISKMITPEGELSSGILVAPSQDDAVFAGAIAKAMIQMLDVEFRSKIAAMSLELGQQYDMGRVADRYINVFEAELAANDLAP